MKIKSLSLSLILVSFMAAALPLPAGSRQDIRELGDRLAQQAAELSQGSFERFKGWKGEISDAEQAVLFKTEAFAASCRLFLRLCEEEGGFLGSDNLRTNLFNAFTYLVRFFRELERDFRSSALSDCRDTLNELERAFSRWPAQDNLAYLHQKFVQARDQTVYLIERTGVAAYVRRPFADLESLYRFNYLLNRSKDPWKYRVEVERATLEKMPAGEPIAMTFNNCLVMDMNERPDRPVYLIENGKKRPLTSPAALARFGGWKAVFEVPASVIESYPPGEPIV